MPRYNIFTITLLFLFTCTSLSHSQQSPVTAANQVDSDKDGLSDMLEQSLLKQFSPSFFIGRHDCSNVPSEFQPNVTTPHPQAENGTIYGQIFPAKISTIADPLIEIHFYHLWRTDCGPHGHSLDTEHVAALIRPSQTDHVTWKAIYWYAAAHENTVCDVSQIARASTLHAEDHGPKVWISPGKHASYLNETLCNRGCGADKCIDMVALPAGKLINLGEPGHPMNGSLFLSSPRWPLIEKMTLTNFPADPIARLNRLPDTDIAWFNAGKHPAQQVIAVSSSTEEALAGSGRNTTEAISTAGESTDAAISVAGDSTQNALQKSYSKTIHALGTSAQHVGGALHITSKPKDP